MIKSKKSISKFQIILLTFTSSLILSCSTTETDPLKEGLVAHYTFDGNANDSGPNSLDAVVFGATLTTDRKGVANSAYSFDGNNDYISISHNPIFNFQDSDYTISLWVSTPEDQVAHNGINDILRKWDGNAEGYPYAISYRNNTVIDDNTDKFLFAQYNSQACGQTVSDTSNEVDNNSFSHIVFKRESNVIFQFVNDILVGSFSDLQTCSTANSANVTFGCRGNLVRFFKGKIDDVRFYNRALSKAEITDLFTE